MGADPVPQGEISRVEIKAHVDGIYVTMLIHSGMSSKELIDILSTLLPTPTMSDGRKEGALIQQPIVAFATESLGLISIHEFIEKHTYFADSTVRCIHHPTFTLEGSEVEMIRHCTDVFSYIRLHRFVVLQIYCPNQSVELQIGFNQLSSLHSGFKFLSANVKTLPDLAFTMGVVSCPGYVFFVDGIQVAYLQSPQRQHLRALLDLTWDSGLNSPPQQLYSPAQLLTLLQLHSLLNEAEVSIILSMISQCHRPCIAAFAEFQSHRNHVKLSEDLLNVSDNMARMKASKLAGTGRTSSILSEHPLYLFIEAISENSLIHPEDLSQLSRMILTDTPVVMAAFDTYLEDGDWNELIETIQSIFCLQVSVDSPPFLEYISSLVADEIIDPSKITLVKEHLTNNETALLAAFSVFLDNRNREEFLDTALHIWEKDEAFEDSEEELSD